MKASWDLANKRRIHLLLKYVCCQSALSRSHTRQSKAVALITKVLVLWLFLLPKHVSQHIMCVHVCFNKQACGYSNRAVSSHSIQSSKLCSHKISINYSYRCSMHGEKLGYFQQAATLYLFIFLVFTKNLAMLLIRNQSPKILEAPIGSTPKFMFPQIPDMVYLPSVLCTLIMQHRCYEYRCKNCMVSLKTF